MRLGSKLVRLPMAVALFAALIVLASGCGSSSNASQTSQSSKPAVTGKPMRIAFRDYRSGQNLELVNQSHTAPAELYSSLQASAARKVQTDEVIEALYEHMRGQGFETHSKPGDSPAQSDGAIVAGMEVEDARGSRHWMAFKGQDAKEKAALMECAKAFVDTYNLTYALQSVDVPPGQDPFKNPVGSTKIKDKQPIRELPKPTPPK